MTSNNSLSAALDSAERQGRLNIHTSELAATLNKTSSAGLRQALQRQQARGRVVHLSRGSGHWVIVPLQYADSGSPPLEVWLDHYLSRTLKLPYYVGLLSAAETYGASPYAVMVTQIVVPTPRRSITVGRHKLVFYTRADSESMPVRWHESADGRYRVSSPELTALELVKREARLGGIARVIEVLQPLFDVCSTAGLRDALYAAAEIPAAQRLGVLLTRDKRTDLAACIQRWLAGHKIRIVTLDAAITADATDKIDPVFKVRTPATFQLANS